MGKVIFDTDVFIEIFNNNQDVFSFINGSIFFENIATTVVNSSELIISANNRETQTKIEKALKDVKILNITTQASTTFYTLIQKYHLSHGLKIADCLITAVCLSYDLPLFTLNTKHFVYIPGLKLISHNIKPIKKGFWS